MENSVPNMENKEADTIESVMREGFEHLGHILPPLVKKRTQTDTKLQDDDVSPCKIPKVCGLKDGCTVSQGSGRQKYLGSVRRVYSQRREDHPLLNTLSEVLVKTLHIFKPIFPRSTTATPSRIIPK